MAKKKSAKKTTKKIATKKPAEIEPAAPAPETTPEPADEYDFDDDLVAASMEDEPTVAEPPKKPVPPTKEAPPEVGELDDDLLTRAVKAGMTIAEARALGSDEAITATLVAIERAVGKAKKTNPTTETAAKAPAPDFKLDLDKDLYEPEVIAAFEGMQAEFTARLEAMQATVTSVTDELLKAASADSERRVDGMFDGLGGDWNDVFGEGPTSALRKTSQHAKNRAKVTDHIAMVEAGAKALDKAVPDDLFHDTVERVFSDHSTSIADAETGDAVSAREGQAMVPPTNREGTPLPREAQAVANARQYMLEHGMEPTDDGYDYDDEQSAFPE